MKNVWRNTLVSQNSETCLKADKADKKGRQI